MTEIEGQYHDLVSKIALKRAVERSLLFFIALCMIGVLILIFFQNSQLRQQNGKLNAEIRNQQQAVSDRTKSILQLENEIKQSTQQNEAYVLCIGRFFDNPNRASETLNISTCQTSSFSPSSQVTPVTTNKQQGSTTPTTNNKSNNKPVTTQPPSTSSPTPVKKPNFIQQLLNKAKFLL